MKKTLLLFCCITSFMVNAQRNHTIYSKSYGQGENPAILFIHGGPRGNATLFEGTTAQKLAEKGFYVIVMTDVAKVGLLILLQHLLMKKQLKI
jgi:proline iminopeptidase